MFDPSSPVTGSAQTGLTSPTYTLTADLAPEPNGEQYAVTALGGTQTGVNAHGVSNPFTITMFRPKTYRGLGTPNPSTGVIPNIPNNVYKIIVRKGVEPASGQAVRPLVASLSISVPAGADSNDELNVRAALSLLFGTLSAESSDIGDTLINGIL